MTDRTSKSTALVLQPSALLLCSEATGFFQVAALSQTF